MFLLFEHSSCITAIKEKDYQLQLVKLAKKMIKNNNKTPLATALNDSGAAEHLCQWPPLPPVLRLAAAAPTRGFRLTEIWDIYNKPEDIK